MSQILAVLGLPVFSSLSVICVEMMPDPNTYVDMVGSIIDTSSYGHTAIAAAAHIHASDGKTMRRSCAQKTTAADRAESGNTWPLSGALGNFRILRTSPLTPVPFVCCT